MEKLRIFVENVFSSLPKTREVIDMKRDILNNMEEHYLELIKQGYDESSAFGTVISEFGSIEDIRHELKLDELMYNESHLPLESDSSMALEFHRKFRNGIIAGVVCCIIAVFGTPLLAGLVENNERLEPLILAWFAVFACIGVIFFIYWGMEKEHFDKSCDLLETERMAEASKRKKKAKTVFHGILWQCTVLIYLAMGFFFGMWHPGWIIFIVSALISNVVNLFF